MHQSMAVIAQNQNIRRFKYQYTGNRCFGYRNNVVPVRGGGVASLAKLATGRANLFQNTQIPRVVTH
jgi:hypothetical protein